MTSNKKKKAMQMTALKLSGSLATVAATALLAACTTFGHKGPGADDDGLAAANEKNTVVIQAGQTDPVVAGHDRQYWLDLRQQKDLNARMRGALATGEAESVVNLARARLAKHPGDAEALTMLAASLALTRNYDLAAYYASQLEKVQPGSPVALNIKGLAAMLMPRARMADFRMAQAYFQQAFNADGSQIAPGLNLGNLQLELGNAAGASQTFASVAGRCDHCTAALMGLGVSSSRAGEFDKAKAAFQAVLAKNPNHAGALYNLALVYQNGYNDNKQAETYLFKLLNDSRTKNVAMREKAQVVLRMIKGEANTDDRRAIADGGSTDDAEVLMTGADKDED
jgi:tetratricopeptide (TPR) repeat protein